jgi:hypothetical protein
MRLPATRDNGDNDDDERKNAELDQFTGLHVFPRYPSVSETMHTTGVPLVGVRNAGSDLRWRATAYRSPAEESKSGKRVDRRGR